MYKNSCNFALLEKSVKTCLNKVGDKYRALYLPAHANEIYQPRLPDSLQILHSIRVERKHVPYQEYMKSYHVCLLR